jgi:hypothetical protein
MRRFFLPVVISVTFIAFVSILIGGTHVRNMEEKFMSPWVIPIGMGVYVAFGIASVTFMHVGTKRFIDELERHRFYGEHLTTNDGHPCWGNVDDYFSYVTEEDVDYDYYCRKERMEPMQWVFSVLMGPVMFFTNDLWWYIDTKKRIRDLRNRSVRETAET